MPKQTAIAKVNEQYLKDRENGYIREYSNTENTARQMLEEYEREQEEQRRKEAERQYAQYQSRQNAEIADWIKGMSPSALADDAQQRRMDTAQGIYTTEADTKHLGSGRAFGTEEAAVPKTASQKKRREDTAYQKYLDQYSGVSNQELFTNADYMQNSARAAQMQRDQMASELAANPGLIFNQDFTQGMNTATAQADAKAKAAAKLTDEYNKVTRLRNRQEERETYGSLNQNADYVKLSQGNAETAERANNSLSPKMIRYYNIYNREKVRNGATTGAPAEAYVTDEEAGKYFYLWEKQGADAAEAYYKTYVKSRAQERRTNAERGNVQALAASSPVMGAAMSAASIPLQATGIIGMIDLTVQNAERRVGINADKPINYNTAWQAPSGQASAIRESVANKIQTDVTKNLIESGHSEKNANLWGAAASFLYQTGMSMADSGVQALLVRVGLPQEAMLTLMAGGAGMNAIREAKQRGASDGEALAYGYAAAFAEGIFEHVSLENLMNAKTPETIRQGVVEVLKQALAEGSEEFSTTYANTLTDMLINGGQSEIIQKVLGYMADGLSNKEAYKAAAINWLKGAGMDFLGGALSGGAMGGMNVGVNLALNVKNNYQAGLIQEDLRNIGRAQQAELAARQAYQAAQERTTPPLPQQAGQEQQDRVTIPPLPQSAQRAAETQQNNGLRIPTEVNARTGDVTGALRDVNPGIVEAVSEDETTRDAVNAVNAEVQKGTISAEAGAELLDMMWQAGSDNESRLGFLRSIYDTSTGELRPQALNAAQRIDARSAGQTLRLSDNAPAAQQAPLTVGPTNDNVNANRQEVNNGQKQAEASAASEFRLRARENAAGRQALGGSEWTTGVARLLEAARNTRTNRNLQQRADAAARLQDQAEARRLVKQSGQDLGIEDASDAKTVTVLDNDMLGKEWEQMVSYYASKGVKLQAMIGQIETKDLRANGKPVTVRAWVSGDGKNIIVQADHPTLSWQQLLAHEELHRRIKENSAFKKAAQDALLADKSLKPYLSQIIDRYTEAYRAVKPSITDDEVIEELLADYRAGFDMLDPLGTLAGVRKATKAAAKDIRALERKGVAQAENNGETQRRGNTSIELGNNGEGGGNDGGRIDLRRDASILEGVSEKADREGKNADFGRRSNTGSKSLFRGAREIGSFSEEERRNIDKHIDNLINVSSLANREISNYDQAIAREYLYEILQSDTTFVEKLWNEGAKIQEAIKSLANAVAETGEGRTGELQEIRKQYASSQFRDKYSKAAESYFKTTTDFSQAGYIDTLGNLLNFNKANWNKKNIKNDSERWRDHQDIYEVLDFLHGVVGKQSGMHEFVNMGNIRIGDNGIELNQKPTKEQRSALWDYAELNPNGFTVDFVDENGSSVGEIPYNTVRPQKLLADIDTYFNTGKVPEQSTTAQFHGNYSTEIPYNRTAILTEDTVDRWLKDYASASSPKYAQAYIARMSPEQFLKLTTSRTGRLVVSSQTGPMEAEKLIEATQKQPLQLIISNGEVVGHEGRHRVTALDRANVRSIPVLVFDSSNKNSKTDVPEMVLQGQDFGSSRSYARVTLENMIPLSYENRDRIVQEYGKQDAFERSAEKLGYRQTMKFSLEPVEAINPISGKWQRGATYDEVKAAHPTLFELAADEAETRNPTQINGTVKTYRKIYDMLKQEGFDGTILDASSGLGYGTRAGRDEYGYHVDDIEPFPDKSYSPKYTDYSKLKKTYDVVISNAVLNVIPQDLRDAMVVKIGEMLNPGGRAFINVRGTDVKNAKSKVAINEDQMEYFIADSGSYQKGFRQAELVDYLKDALGDGFTVTPNSSFGGVSAVVTKNGGKASTEIETAINQSMTMEQARNMIQRAFVLAEIKEWYDGKYKNGDEWLQGEGAEDVAMIVDNEETLQHLYLNKIPGVINGDFYAEDIIEAYKNGTLTGKEKKPTEKADLSNSKTVSDSRFYAPKQIENAKELFEKASQRMTKSNEKEIIAARAAILLYAHNKGAAETLGLTDAELNKRLRSWSNYSAKAREVSQRINAGVTESNRWTGIENSSYAMKATVTQDEVANVVGKIEGDGDGYQNKYIARTVLALDTHIDWSWLNFKFDTPAGVNAHKSSNESRCNGYYTSSNRQIHVKRDAPNTVAHEMGHALDDQWGREVGVGGFLSQSSRNSARISDEVRPWFDRFHEFCDTLADSSDIRSSYSGDIKETFARFIDRFVGWTEMLATGYTPQDRGWYNDKFTTAQYVQFARLLQEKAALDANGATRNQVLSDEAGKASTEIDAEYMAAAESGDMEKAQRMVDEAAKKAGFVTAAYHGTDYYKEIRVFKGGKSGYLGPGIYLTPVRGIAQRYADKSGGNGTVYNVFTKIKNPFVVTETVPAKEILREITGSDKVFDRRMAKEGWESRVLTKADMKKLQDLGYDGVIWRYGTSPEEYLVFDSNQIKSADPVTYDDNGNIIPLSERFNPANNDIRYSVEIDPDVAKQFSMEGIEERQVQSLLRENEELKKKLKDAKAQVKTSDRTQPREEDVRRMARDILKAYSSKADGNQVNESLRELAHTVMSNDARWTDIRDQAVRLAGKILEESSVLVGDDAALNREIRNAIRKEKIAYTNNGNIPDYGQWRKDNFGKLKIAKDGLPLETRWEELQDTYGKGYFPDDIKNPADQIVYLSELYDRLQDVYENPYNQNMAEATEFLANDIIDRVISGEMRQAPTTYADRAKTRLARETLRGELREQKIKERLEAERERRKEQIAELKEHYKGKEAKGRESRKAKELRTKIINHAKQMTTELLKPTDKKHVPESLRKSVAAVLSAIDLGSGYDMTAGQNGNTLRVGRGTEGAEQTKRTKAFLELKEALMKEADGLVLDPELLGTVEEPGSLTRLITELADVPIANMNTEQLQVVYDALRGIEGAVKSANRMLSQARWAAVSEAADAIRSENGSKIAPLQLAGPAGRVQDLTRLDMLTPEGYFHRLGKSGQAVFKLLRSAQDKFITNMTQATEATRKIVGDADVGAMEKETHTLTMGGQEVTMTTAQIMELYCLMQRDQGLQHITTGGVLIEPVRKGIKQETQVEPLHPSMEELLNAVRLLTPDEVKMADALQKYLSEDLAELGNEATLNVYGYKKFGQEAKYWKIRSNKNEIQQSIEKETQTTSVANRGFTKAINPQANTSIKIGSIFDTYSQSVNDMATYAAWLDVGEDVNRIRNYVFRDSEGQRTGTVKGVLDRVIGTGGANYLQRLLADIANGAGMDDAGLTSGFVGAYKAAAIGANIRVIAQQPTAILRAAEMIDPKYLAVGLKNPMKAFERAKEYSPIAQWKDWGYFDINTGRKMKDVLFESSSKLEKVRQASMAMAGKADSFAWGQLWGAVEAETKDKTDLKPGTKEFYQACAERFNDIIDHTQVVDGILQRSQIMRSKNAITRMAVSFMSEPTKQYNQFMSAVYDYRHSGDKKQAKQMLARTTFSMVAAGILNVMAQALVDGLRDDDREKKYWDKVLQAFLGYNPDDNTFGEKFKTFAFSNMGEFINPASYLPYAKDIMSIIQGYSVDRMDMDAISDTITAMTRLYKAMNGEGKQSAGYSLVKAMEQAAKLLGLSVYNIDRDLTALFTTIANDADMPVLQYYLNRYRYKPTENLSKDLKGILWDARQKNDGSYDVIVNRLLKDGYTQEGIDKAMMNRLSDESGFTEARKAADAEGNNNGSYDLGETLAALDSIEVSEEDRDILLEAKLSEKQYSNYTTLLQYSDYDTWLSVMREMPANLSQAKIETVLDKRDDLTTKQKAAYWQVLSGATSTKNNPYSQEVGTEILNAKAENQPDKEPEKVAQMRSTLSGLGVPDSKVDALAPVLGGDGTNTSKWRAVANQNLGKDQQDAVLKSIMTDSMYRNWTIVSGENISLDSYVKGREAYVDLDDSGTDQNSEWTAALEKVTFDKDTTRNNYIKGVLWQIYTGSTSTKNNPFDKTGGQKVLDAKGKGGGKGTGSNAPARIPTLRLPEVPRAEKPSSGLRISTQPSETRQSSGLRLPSYTAAPRQSSGLKIK